MLVKVRQIVEVRQQNCTVVSDEGNLSAILLHSSNVYAAHVFASTVRNVHG